MSSPPPPASAMPNVPLQSSDSAASAAVHPATPTHASPRAATAATHPPAPVVIAPATHPAFSAAAAEPRRDLTDLPPDVLPVLFSRMPPGSRLDPRVVCRAWSSWVDHTLAASTHLNLVLDLPELRRALRRRQRQLRQQHRDGGGGGDGGSDLEPPPGLLAAKFPAAKNVRLWVGCRPSAALAGRNGGGAAAAAAAEAVARRNAAGDAAAAALAAASASVVSSVQRLQEGLEDAASAFSALCLQVLAPRQPPWPVIWRQWRQERRRQDEQMPRMPRWHVHRSGDPGGAQVTLLRRYAPDRPDVGLEPLSCCLPLLGPSTRLMRLSIVSAHDLTHQDLVALREAFPRLAALAIHSHRDSTLDFIPASLPTLEPFFPQTAAAAAADADAAVAAPSAAAGLPVPSNPGGSSGSESSVAVATAAAGGDSSGVGPQPGAAASAAQQPARQQQQQLRSLLLSGLRLDLPDGPGGGGLAALTQLRALVLHRTSGRMHRLLPQIKALTQLTRLELRGLDYHHALPLDSADQSLIDSKMLFLEQLQLQRRRRAAAAAADGGAAARHASPPEPGSDGSADEDEWEEACRPLGGAQGGAARHAPWMWALPGCGAQSMARCARPDWHATLRALGRTVRQLDELKVLVCDVECPPAPPLPAPLGGVAMEAEAAAEVQEEGEAGAFPPALGPAPLPARKRRGAWDLLLAGVCRIRNLQELRLPYMVLQDASQVAALAAALPALTTLELASLPPPPPPPLHQRPHSLEQKRRAMDALWRRYFPLAAGCGGDGGGGGGGGGGEGCAHCGAIRTQKTEFEIDVELEAEAGAGPGLGGFLQLRELVLHRGGVRQLSYWLPLPPRLQRLEAPVQRGNQTHPAPGGDEEEALSAEDLHLLHSRLLPALSSLPHLALKLHRVDTSLHRRRAEPPPLPPPPGTAAVPETTNSTNTNSSTITNTRTPATPRPSHTSTGTTAAASCGGTTSTTATTAAATPTHGSGTPPAAADAAGSSVAGRLPPALEAAVKAGEVLAVAMLAAWLPGSLTRLDLAPVTAPGSGLGEVEAIACLQIAAEGLPQLRALSCCLRAGSGTGVASRRRRRSSSGGGGSGGRVPLDWEQHPSQALRDCDGGGGGGGSRGCAAGPWAGGSGGAFGAIASWLCGEGTDSDGGGGAGGCRGDRASPPEQQEQRRRLHTAVECFNAMPRLEELRVKVFAPAIHAVPNGSRSLSYHAVRVPMGFLRALRRPVRVVDCSPLDAWCSLEGAVHPREALCQARAALAAGGFPATLLSETEEFAAGAMGLAPDMEDKWRGPLEVL